MNTSDVEPFTLIPGASWLTSDGSVLPVSSFHEEWMRDHPELALGSRNVCELILRTGWVSVALFSGGYLELMVPNRRAAPLVDLLHEFLSRNAGLWSKALVMSMDEEGYAMLGPEDARDRDRFALLLGSSL
ncbi:MAG: hypothetical protein ACLQMF_14965 [Rectinemataceae bacterium]